MMAVRLWTRIINLDYSVDLDSFHCDEPELDIWVHRDALEQQEESSCAVHVALDDSDEVIGIFTLSSYYLQHRVIPQQTKDDTNLSGNIPCVLLGRLAVNKEYQGKSQGSLLVKEAIQRARKNSIDVGCRFLYTQALNDDLIDWYRKLGFISLPRNPRNMLFDLKSQKQ